MIVQLNSEDVFKIIIVGRIKVISTSKIKKIIAIKKNCKEKGNRDKFFGSNPHSNGEHFSRSENDFLDNKEAKTIIITVIIRIIKAINLVMIIIYTKFI